MRNVESDSPTTCKSWWHMHQETPIGDPPIPEEMPEPPPVKPPAKLNRVWQAR